MEDHLGVYVTYVDDLKTMMIKIQSNIKYEYVQNGNITTIVITSDLSFKNYKN